MTGAATPQTAGNPAVLPHERRLHPRIGVMWMATLRSASGLVECIVLDVSCGGAKLALSTPITLRPGAGATLVIEGFGSFRASGVWQRQDYVGIRFLDPPETIARAFPGVLAL